ncbi:hypothetical protein, partial [Pseudaquabacterium rugosum]
MSLWLWLWLALALALVLVLVLVLAEGGAGRWRKRAGPLLMRSEIVACPPAPAPAISRVLSRPPVGPRRRRRVLPDRRPAAGWDGRPATISERMRSGPP